MKHRRASERSRVWKTCFLITPIDSRDSEIRSRSDDLRAKAIDPALARLGLKSVRADTESVPGLITPQIIRFIANADLVIADLTGGNPNVMYELAIAHMLRRPTIQIIEDENRIPFDVRDMKTIVVVRSSIDSSSALKNELTKQIKQVVETPQEFPTPVSEGLRRYSDQFGVRLSDFIQEVADLGPDFKDLGKALIRSLRANAREPIDANDLRGIQKRQKAQLAIIEILEQVFLD